MPASGFDSFHVRIFLPATTSLNSSVSASYGFRPMSCSARWLTASNSGSPCESGRTYVYSAPLTMRGPSICRGASCESFGLGNASSAGRFDVKTFDLGRDCSVCSLLDELFAVCELSRCAMTWLRRIKVWNGFLQMYLVDDNALRVGCSAGEIRSMSC